MYWREVFWLVYEYGLEIGGDMMEEGVIVVEGLY